MQFIALKMLLADRAKFAGLLFGIAFTSFLVTFAASYFCGFMTLGFSLISENPQTDVWVMDPAVRSVEQTINMPDSVLQRVRSIDGVRYAAPLELGNVDARFANGRFQSFQVIAVDDASLRGAPALPGQNASALRSRNAVIVAAGGTSNKLLTPERARDQWPHDGTHLHGPMRPLASGDELKINGHIVYVLGKAATLARYPARPLLYTTIPTAERILPAELHRLTFVMVQAVRGISPRALARRIRQLTGLRARARADFISDTVRWYLVNSEDVGDIAAMLILAMTMGFGVTGVMLFMFELENQHQFAILKAMGTTPRSLVRMILLHTSVVAFLGTGIGLGLCGIAGMLVNKMDFPFRMMWFTPLAGMVGVVLVSLLAAVISIRPVLKVPPAVVFAVR